MSVNRLPTGVAVAQAKKDAKRLANKSEIHLSHAQNEVALKHGRADWPTLMNQLKTQSALSATLKQSFLNKVTLDFPENKSLNIVVGQSGSGKTMLLLEFAAQWLQKGFPVLYLGADVSQGYQCGAATNSLISKYPSLFTAIPLQSLTKGFVLDDVMLNGAILLADELPHMVSSEVIGITTEQVQKLINCSMHTFLGFQILGEAQEIISDLKNVTDDNTRFVILKCYAPDIYANSLFEYDRKVMAEEVERLEKKHNKYTELLYVEQNSYQKLRFKLADHHAL
ncbi:hypothetical protein MKZ42_03195 [Pseudoalteromonas shioyasakiensis]|uniref:Uncharacterized protein n=1 Tax=Pseudoalteromonas shioyasakiensis TaxID=1190813 RepID=A0ABT6U495_9GAMM|nr:MULTISPECIES: ATP-binding protein [Pseudoalteromonas]MDI4670993.1 hypothetical protein [Pseudoalteromonas shioyasakiensis]MDI4672268.1 hypothetical protein [Pseudoalteromonas shioyasakiensis]MDI4687902.1 hypothetical protein [Pseudoalteromonas shioyasakiensis]MDI4706498.1 hypothetical protein [Pseudoalteromonas shioyasakiensis]NUJ23250.1 hypothetical protein [Pseudoalteromonas sp. 0802]